MSFEEIDLLRSVYTSVSLPRYLIRNLKRLAKAQKTNRGELIKKALEQVYPELSDRKEH